MPPVEAASGSKRSGAAAAPRKRISTVKDALKNAALAPGQQSLFAVFRKGAPNEEQNAGERPSAPSKDVASGQKFEATSDTGVVKGRAQLTYESCDPLANLPAVSAGDDLSPKKVMGSASCDSKPLEKDAACLAREVDVGNGSSACTDDVHLRASPTPMQKIDELLPRGLLSQVSEQTKHKTLESKSLRERLNKRLHASDGIALSERAPGLSLPDADVKMNEHKTIGGGVSLQWRFLLDPAARDAVREKRRRTEDSSHRSASELSSPEKHIGLTSSELPINLSSSHEISKEKVAPELAERQTEEPTAEDALESDVSKDRWPSADQSSSGENEERHAKIEDPKHLLEKLGLDYSACARPKDMQALLERYHSVCSRPLSTLRALCFNLTSAAHADADTCARFLLKPASQRRAPSGSVSSGADSLPASTLAERIIALQPCRFPSRIAFAFAIFSLESMHEPSNTASLQSSYRQFMRKLHPDRVGTSKCAAQALELVQEAKRLCELALSNTHAPLMPHALRATSSVSSSGSRKVQLTWQPSPHREEAPVDRYIVAAVDPGYGHRVINLAVLEPDYCDKLGRFISINDLCTYTVDEDASGRVSAGLLRHPNVTLKVAAANAAGQSSWATATVSWNRDQTLTLSKSRKR